MPLPITADHPFEVPSVSQPNLFADGSTLAFVETTVDREKMERKARVMVSRHPFDEASALTEGPEDTAPVVESDWGGEDFLDILASVDELATRPYVDEDRMAVHGSATAAS